MAGLLTRSINDSSLGLALRLEERLNLLGFDQSSDLVDTHLRAYRAVLAEHLRTQAGCGLARREVGGVDTRLVNNNIVIGGTGAEGGGKVLENRGSGLDIGGVRQDPKGDVSCCSCLNRGRFSLLGG